MSCCLQVTFLSASLSYPSIRERRQAERPAVRRTHDFRAVARTHYKNANEVINYRKKKEKCNAVDSFDSRRKEGDCRQSEAGSDVIDRLPDRVFPQNDDQGYRFIIDPCGAETHRQQPQSDCSQGKFTEIFLRKVRFCHRRSAKNLRRNPQYDGRRLIHGNSNFHQRKQTKSVRDASRHQLLSAGI